MICIFSKAKLLEQERRDAVADVEMNRVAYEDMARRAVWTGGTAPGDSASMYERFSRLVESAKQTSDERELDRLVEEAQALAQARAYFCPEKEILTEAKAHFFNLLDWGVPSKSVDSLKEATSENLNGQDVAAARGALHAIYEEYDAWDKYLDEYNANTSFWASVFLGGIACCAFAALLMMFGWSFRILALVLAAMVGAGASVIARLPGVTTSGDWEVNLRGYQARIGTGIVGSLVGIGLLGSGLISISLPAEMGSADQLLNACLDSTAQGCTRGRGLFVLAVTMLLGFSERVLTSLESRVVSGQAGASGKGPG
jgi:hypothetical protein